MRIALRCDGDATIGVGHVARCLRLANVLRRRGAHCQLVGRVSGTAAAIVRAAGVAVVPPPSGRPCGLPVDADAALVDSYDIPTAEIETAAVQLPLAVLLDGTEAPEGATVISYHLDAVQRLGETLGLLGPDFAPIDPRFAAARRERTGRRVLVTAGGGRVGKAAVRSALESLASDGRWEVYVAAHERPSGLPHGVDWGWEHDGLVARAIWADLALTAAGSAPYELACAGVPSLLLAVAENQVPIARAFERAGLARSIDARGGIQLGAIADAWERTTADAAELTAAGPAAIDGYGSFRVADGLLCLFDGSEPPTPLRYRPATRADRDLLLAWRNDPQTRAASRSRGIVEDAEHDGWLASVLADRDCTLLVACGADGPLGSVRFDRAGEEAEISVVLAPSRRGAGLGTRMIAEATELQLASRPELRRVVAEVGPENERSLAAFQRAGYRPLEDEPRGGGTLLAHSVD